MQLRCLGSGGRGGEDSWHDFVYSQEIRESEYLRLKVRDKDGGIRIENKEGCRTVVACRVVGEE